jgi:hypothetical protein
MNIECTTNQIARFSGELEDYDLNTFVEMITGIDHDLAHDIAYRTNVDILDVIRWIVTVSHALGYAHHNSITDKWGISGTPVCTLQDYQARKDAREAKFNEEDILGDRAREIRKREGTKPGENLAPWEFDGEVVSARMKNCLRNIDVYTYKQAALFSARELLNTPNFGRKTLKELRELLEFNQLSLKGD